MTATNTWLTNASKSLTGSMHCGIPLWQFNTLLKCHLNALVRIITANDLTVSIWLQTTGFTSTRRDSFYAAINLRQTSHEKRKTRALSREWNRMTNSHLWNVLKRIPAFNTNDSADELLAITHDRSTAYSWPTCSMQRTIGSHTPRPPTCKNHWVAYDPVYLRRHNCRQLEVG
jgi:hypothetical protein